MERQDWLGRFSVLVVIATIVASLTLGASAGAGSQLRATPGTPASLAPATPMVESGPITSESGGIYGDAWEFLSEGEPGELSVVAIGSLSAYSVGVVIKNNTDQPVGMVSITAEIRDPSGKLIGVPDDSYLRPQIIEPGGYAIGALSSNPSVPEGSTATVYIDAADNGVEFAQSMFPEVSLTLVEFSVGSDQILGVVENQTDTPLQGDGFATVVCFGGDGTLTGVEGTTIKRSSLKPDDRSPFEVWGLGVVPDCTHFLVTSYGEVSKNP